MQSLFRPLRDHIAVRPIVRELSSVLWVDNRENFCHGVIAACGPKATAVSEGDYIIYGGEQYLNWKVFYDEQGAKYQLIQEADICAVVDELKEKV